MNIPDCRRLCHPDHHNCQQSDSSLYDFTLVVICWILQADGNLIERSNDKLIEEITAIDEVLKELVTCNDSFLQELVKYLDRDAVEPLVINHLMLNALKQLVSYGPLILQFVEEVLLVFDAQKNYLSERLHYSFINLHLSVSFWMLRTVVVQIEGQYQVNLWDDYLVQLMAQAYLDLVCLMLLFEVAMQELHHFRLHIAAKSLKVSDRMQVEEDKHVKEDHLVIARA